MIAATPELIPQGEPLEAVPTLRVRELSLQRGERVVLDDVAFDIAPGEIVGVLGPNGCGKSSMVQCITGTLQPHQGRVFLSGEQLTEHNQILRARIGVVFQEPSLDRKLTVRENLQLSAVMFCVPRPEARTRVDELLRFMELDDRQEEPVEKLSGGLRRRLELARALIHSPSLLVLDEPTTGLDPHAFEKTWVRLLALRRERDLAMLVTTHRADEAEKCDRLVIMDRGHVVTMDTPDNLLRRVSGDVIVVETTDAAKLAREIQDHFELEMHVEGHRILLEVEQAHEFVPRLVESLPKGRFRSIAVRRPSLADAFFHLTGHALREEVQT